MRWALLYALGISTLYSASNTMMAPSSDKEAQVGYLFKVIGSGSTGFEPMILSVIIQKNNFYCTIFFFTYQSQFSLPPVLPLPLQLPPPLICSSKSVRPPLGIELSLFDYLVPLCPMPRLSTISLHRVDFMKSVHVLGLDPVVPHTAHTTPLSPAFRG